jgi:hypothetical protein
LDSRRRRQGPFERFRDQLRRRSTRPSQPRSRRRCLRRPVAIRLQKPAAPKAPQGLDPFDLALDRLRRIPQVHGALRVEPELWGIAEQPRQAKGAWAESRADPKFGMLMATSSVVVVGDLDVVSLAIREPETDAPRVVDGDGMLARSIAMQFVKPIPGRCLKVVEPRRQVDVLELAHRSPEDVGWQPLRRSAYFVT